MKKILLAAVVAVALVACCVIGGTLAWLTDQTTPITNTFTVGNVGVTLAETTGTDYKVLPGQDITKDPKVTVTAGSEACYLFVKVEESANWPMFTESDGTRKVNYTIAEGWTALEGDPGVYYRTQDPVAGTPYDVLAGNVVTVSENLTKNEVNDITEAFTLTVTAYAVQKDGIDTPADAWAKVQP